MYYHDVTGKEWYVEGGKWGENGEQCHAAQIVVNELIFKLLCSYRWENQAWEKEKEEEEEIKAVQCRVQPHP